MKANNKWLIAIDFDGVIAKKWHKPKEVIADSFAAIRKFINEWYCVYIFTARRPKEVIDFMYDKVTWWLKFEIIPYYYNFWDKHWIIWISNKKLPADIYIDDNAYRFTGDWNKTYSDISKMI